MPKVKVKGTVTPDHTVTVNVPENWPEGSEVEAVIEPIVKSRTDNSSAALKRLFEEIDALDFPRRTAEEIDAELEAERTGWDS